MIKVAIQGEKGSYSECATVDFFRGQEIQPVTCVDYSELFERVDSGEADCMVIPIENSSAGSVFPYYDLLLEYATGHGFRATAELKLRIRHNLIGHPDADLDQVKLVHSHFQALDQCRGFLRSRGLSAQAVYDTAGAAKQIKATGRKDVAAVASAQAAHDLGMKILARNIQDQTDNYTRFLRVEKNPASVAASDGRTKVSVVFCIPNIPGSLFRTTAAFGSRADVSVIRIESRPLVGTATKWHKFVRPHSEGQDEGVWDLLYYLDFETPEKKRQAVLDHLSELVMEVDGAVALQVLGTYPTGPLRDITGERWR